MWLIYGIAVGAIMARQQSQKSIGEIIARVAVPATVRALVLRLARR